MKRLALTISILVLPALPVRAQPSTPPTQGAAAMRGAGLKQMSLPDLQARQRARMMRMDADHDGRISLAEWSAWRSAHPGRAEGGDPARMFQRLDANRDGYLSAEEIDAKTVRRFARMDANHDGTVTAAERAILHSGRGEPVQPLSPR